jgi:hypothetical protein
MYSAGKIKQSNTEDSGMAYEPGSEAPQTGIYWCSVCKLPVQFKTGETLPKCKNLCGRGKWEFIRAEK